MSLGWDSENPGRTAKTTSISFGYCSGCNRKDSLIIRLMRFLLTAPRIFRCTLIPSRPWPEIFGRYINVKPSPCKRLPLLYTLSNSHPFRRRELLRNRSFPNVSGGKPLPAPCPSRIKNRPTGPCFHSGTKPMPAFAFNIARLKCSFTHCLLSSPI